MVTAKMKNCSGPLAKSLHGQPLFSTIHLEGQRVACVGVGVWMGGWVGGR
jgi:hypothetical protein